MPEPSSTVTKSSATTRHADGVDRQRVERPLVVAADEVGDRDRPDDLDAVAEHGLDARRGDHEVAAASGTRTRTYSTSGPTAAPTFDTSVHGVVVQTSRS